MLPVIFKIPGLGWEIPGYGFALMIGFLLSIFWAVRRATKSGGNPDVVIKCSFLAILGGVVGARFMYVVHYWDKFALRGSALQVFLGILDVRKGGLEVYGGFICVVVLVFLYLRLGKHSIRWYLDILAPSAALGHAITRIGCFLNGCCWGGVCAELPWAVRFPFGSPVEVQQWQDRVPGAELPQQLLAFGERKVGSVLPLPREALRASDRALDTVRARFEEATRDLRGRLEQATDADERQGLREQMLAAARRSIAPPGRGLEYAGELMSKYKLTGADLHRLAREHPSLAVQPTQLYTTVTLGLLALFLDALYWRRTRDGQVICALLLIEPWTRWVLETLRADNPVDTLGVLTISQFLAICLSAAGLVGLLWLRKLPPRSARAVLWAVPAAGGAGPSARRADAKNGLGRRHGAPDAGGRQGSRPKRLRK